MAALFQAVLMRLALCGLAASLTLLLLRSRIARDTFARLLSIWRSLTALGRVAVCSFLLIGILIGGDKTNNVPPNMGSPLPQMMQGGLSQTGSPGLTGFVGEGNLVNFVNHVQTTSDDIARGWRVECVTTNAAVSYAMPTNAALVGNWHVHGAASSFGNNRIDFCGWSFPLGTNGAAFSSFWYFIDGRIRPTPRDVAHEICAVGVPMSAVSGQSRLWTTDESDGARVITWENFFLGGDTNCPVSAQVRLYSNGDFTTRSNEVETVCRRVNPDDWDDDGIANDIDLNPLVCDGDFFGPANILPAGANTNAYCTVSVVATGPDALVTFAGDKTSNYPDPCFVAKSGVTNEVVILIGKTYTISSDWPFAVVGVSDPDTEVWQMRGVAHQTHVCRPVDVSVSEGNPLMVSILPANLGGEFSWATNCCCLVSGSGTVFEIQCSSGCACGGCQLSGTYGYEGYEIILDDINCMCAQNSAVSPMLSFAATPSTILYEAEHTDENGALIPRRSTFSVLSCTISNCDDGVLTLVDVSGACEHLVLHLYNESGVVINLPYVCQLDEDMSITIVAEALRHGMSTNDICIAAVYDSGDVVLREELSLTIFEVISKTQSNHPNRQRKKLGVGEPFALEWKPNIWDVVNVDNDLVDYGAIAFETPHSATSFSHSVSCGGATLPFNYMAIEPQELEVAWVYGTTNGEAHVAGDFKAHITINVMPTNVSFEAVQVQEIPSFATNVVGYFSGMTNILDHGNKGAGRWHGIGWHQYDDMVSITEVPPPWMDGGCFTWPITNAWRVAGDNSITNHFSHRLRYDQTFELDSNGTVRIKKMGYVIQRTTNDVFSISKESQ